MCMVQATSIPTKLLHTQGSECPACILYRIAIRSPPGSKEARACPQGMPHIVIRGDDGSTGAHIHMQMHQTHSPTRQSLMDRLVKRTPWVRMTSRFINVCDDVSLLGSPCANQRAARRHLSGICQVRASFTNFLLAFLPPLHLAR